MIERKKKEELKFYPKDKEVSEEYDGINMREILHRAEIRKWGKPKEKVNLQHLSPNRLSKKAKYFGYVSFHYLLLL